MRESQPPVGVLLAGGKSSRMGQDKAWLPFFGQPMFCHVARVLANVTGEILVSGRDPADFGLDAPWLPDDVPGQGPAGAVLTVLTATARPCLIVSCDLPFLDEATLFRLLAARGTRAPHVLMTTFRIVEKGYIESLVAIYEPAGIAHLRHELGRGERKLSKIYPETVRLHVDYSLKDEAVARAFFNVNSKEDLHKAQNIEKQYTETSLENGISYPSLAAVCP